MIIFYDDNGYIKQYVTFSDTDVPDLNKVELPERLIPDDFYSDFKPNYFIYNGNKVIKNEFYQPPKPTKEGPSRLDILEQLVQLQAKELLSQRKEG